MVRGPRVWRTKASGAYAPGKKCSMKLLMMFLLKRVRMVGVVSTERPLSVLPRRRRRTAASSSPTACGSTRVVECILMQSPMNCLSGHTIARRFERFCFHTWVPCK